MTVRWPSANLAFTRSLCPPQLNVLLVLTTYLTGFINAAIHMGLTFQLPFCHSSVINHFFCDIPPLLKLTCSDTRVNEAVILAFASFNELSCLLTILTSYLCILTAIVRIRSADGGTKPSPPAHPTRWWSPSSLAQSCSCICAPAPASKWTKTKCCLCFIQWSSPC